MKILSLVLVSALATGCTFGNARVVRETKTGGEIALEGMRDEAQKKADAVMTAKCPSGFDIDEQGEAVVGSTTNSDTSRGRSSGFSFGRPSTNTQSTSRDATEWRIKYHCKGAEPTIAAPAEGEKPAEGTAKPAGAQQSRVQHELVIRF